MGYNQCHHISSKYFNFAPLSLTLLRLPLLIHIHDWLHSPTRIIPPSASPSICLSIDPSVNIMSYSQATSKLNHSYEIPIQPAYIPSIMAISTSAPFLWLTTAAATLFCYLSWIIIYRLHLSPISSFPGPRLAALTFWSVISFLIFIGYDTPSSTPRLSFHK